MNMLFSLFFSFAKIGCLAFGGGYAALPILERELIEKRNWTTTEELLRYFTIAQITPGVIAVNVSTFIGYKMKGVAGGIAATLGFVLPSVTMTVITASVVKSFSNIPIIQHTFNGIRLAVGALILNTVLKLLGRILKKDGALFQNIIAVLLCAAGFFSSVIWNVNPVFIVLAAGFTGFLLSGKSDKKKSQDDV
ncbi:MAG: chromate transporter [Spirochaetaceae bacterium]|jgi:chromate transporter|nr:chromate transporter [Spirochaetaceae bacterium]